MVSDERPTAGVAETRWSPSVRTREQGDEAVSAGRRALRVTVYTAAVAVIASMVTFAQDTGTVSQTPAPSTGLSDLAAVTFSCPQAGLNAAAREAAVVPSQGTYQFSYFRIVNDAHHAAFEVHFKSNYVGEPELKYCVSLYCQQGWDPQYFSSGSPT